MSETSTLPVSAPKDIKAVVAAKPRLSRAKRDQAIRRLSRRVQKLADLEDAKFAFVVRAFSRVTLLVERAYAELRDQQSLLGPDGELRPSVNIIRQLSDSQVKIAKELNLTPSALRSLKRERPADLAAAFARIDDGEPG